MTCNVYSLPDCRTVLNHPDVSTVNLHQCGHGKITVAAAGVLPSGMQIICSEAGALKIEDRIYDKLIFQYPVYP